MSTSLLTALKDGECVIGYTKVDTNEERYMHCTLNPDLIPEGYSFNQDPTSYEIVVWATDRNDWRSVRYDTIIEWHSIKGCHT